MSIDRRAFLRLAALTGAAAGGGVMAACRRPQGAAAASGVSPGTRWAMAVDLNRCAGAGECTKCVDACHRVHNVPALAVAGREVKWVWKEPFERAFPEHVAAGANARHVGLRALVLCNHCDAPPCVRVCPTGATWKREDGLVMMDWHRCIGCRYCVAACPYGSRSFNWADPRPGLPALDPGFPTRTRGVVEKCTFCEERLAAGRPPACVEACTEGALVFGNLADARSGVRGALGGRFSIRRRPELGTGPGVHYLV